MSHEGSSRLSRRVDLDVVSLMEVSDAVQSAAETFALAEGLDGDAAHFLGIAVREALVNAVVHGSEGDERRRIHLRFEIDEFQDLVMTVSDEGPGFDPAQVPDPLAPENVQRGSGRGIFYMRRFADEVSFRFPSGKGTIVVLKKRLARRGMESGVSRES